MEMIGTEKSYQRPCQICLPEDSILVNITTINFHAERNALVP